MKKDPLRIVSIVVTMLSISVSVVIFVSSQRQKQLDGAIILKQAEKLLQSGAIIREHEKRIAAFQGEINLTNDMLLISRHKTDSLIYLSKQKDLLINQLQAKLHEDPVYIDADDAEQLRIFLRWTTR